MFRKKHHLTSKVENQKKFYFTPYHIIIILVYILTIILSCVHIYTKKLYIAHMLKFKICKIKINHQYFTINDCVISMISS